LLLSTVLLRSFSVKLIAPSSFGIMNNITRFLTSSIGQKLLMGMTGLFLCSFLVVHLAGNFLLFKGDGGAAFDQYSLFMSTNPVIRTIELGLFAALLLHSIFGLRLWMENRKVRPERYAVSAGTSTSTTSSRITFITGSMIFIFLVIHLRTFFVPARFSGEEISMYRAVVEAFASPLYSSFYVIAMVLLGYHLRHGFQSAFQTFGIRGKKYEAAIEVFGFVFWFLIPLGFATMPVYFLFGMQ
jgi:succinate dehydrogenase / fumarate reductase cytochrome b subunit